ncbi:hypothetical protein MSMEG_6550 [Mycolicibacterium smegmatis MC2 155]|uniref:Uncharacterized protein n=1 Tax=Mycolicibacterium smegmatis (strain ATCC 700084 / mc(2)155) TaxID=246196 RepID=A0R6H4_MYCS2|nr:hypothetical protein MSMEG_6550 [Mycolicibacterium smegmatis MC2 155]
MDVGYRRERRAQAGRPGQDLRTQRHASGQYRRRQPAHQRQELGLHRRTGSHQCLLIPISTRRPPGPRRSSHPRAPR